MPLFAPLSQAERRALREAPASTVPQQLAALLQLHHTRVIVRATPIASHHVARAAEACTLVAAPPAMPPPPVRFAHPPAVPPQDLFRALDKNADGEVTKSELAQALRSLGVQASGAELEELFAQLDPDGSGGIVFRELQQAILAASREPLSGGGGKRLSQPPSRIGSKAGSQAASRSASQPSSPTKAGQGRWTMYDQLEPTEATGGIDGESGVGGGAEETGTVSELELTLLEEMVQVAIAGAAQEGDGSGSSGGVTLLRMLSAYEVVLERHQILAIEDTRHYQLLLQLSLLPHHDWRDKLAAFQSLHRTASATAGRLPAHISPLDGGHYGRPPLPTTESSATASLRLSASSLHASTPAAPPQPSPGRRSTASRPPPSPVPLTVGGAAPATLPPAHTRPAYLPPMPTGSCASPPPASPFNPPPTAGSYPYTGGGLGGVRYESVPPVTNPRSRTATSTASGGGSYHPYGPPVRAIMRGELRAGGTGQGCDAPATSPRAHSPHHSSCALTPST